MPTTPWRSIIALLALLGALLGASGGDADIPHAAKSTDDIVAAAEKVKGFGTVNTAEFRHCDKHSLALWYCPFSGVGNCYFHVYVFDHAKDEWVQAEGELIEAGGDLTVELPEPCDTLVVRNSDGAILRKVPLAGVTKTPTTHK